MSTVIHIVTDALPPTRGGLETWTHDFAIFLVKAGHTVIAYKCGDHPSITSEIDTNYEICDVAELRSNLDKPLRHSNRAPDRISLEIWRLNFLLLRNEIKKRLLMHADRPHLVFSNFAVGVGYLASLVSQDLSLAHLAMFAGTDFSRGFRNSRERIQIHEVCSTAYLVICKSEEQAKALRHTYAPKRLCVIPTSVNCPQHQLRNFGQLPIRLFSDCGLSYHKGTQVLGQSVLALLSEGLPIRLTLCGSGAITETQYWNQYMADVIKESCGSIEYLGYVKQSSVQELLLDASIYCSASLGEGSSAARLAALCSGIPVVTTRCGEFLWEVEEGISHIFLSEPGDLQGFTGRLRDATNCILRGELDLDQSAIEKWRIRFSRENEFSVWSTVLNEFENRL